MSVFSRLSTIAYLMIVLSSYNDVVNGLTITDTHTNRESSDNDTETCYGKKECAGDNIDADYVDCGGYLGCYEAEIIASKGAYLDGFRGGQEADIYAKNDAYCGGYLGCFQADIYSKSNLICDGHSSCWHSEIVADDDIFILGYRSAGASEIYGNSNDVSLWTFGSYGTIYSVIEEVSTIYNYGSRGLFYADINSDDVDQLNVWSMGRHAGRNAQIYCRSGTTCNVFCRDYGCYDLEIRCFKGAKCKYTLFNSDCDSAPTIFYSKDEDDDTLFNKLYLTRKEVKKVAKTEFKNIYKKDDNETKTIEQLNKIVNGKVIDNGDEKHLSELDDDFHDKFDTIFEEVMDRYNLIDGKLKEIIKRDPYLIVNPNIDNDDDYENNNNKVLFASTMNGNSRMINNETIFTISGIIVGLIVLFGANKLLIKNKTNNDNSNNRYQYQSI